MRGEWDEAVESPRRAEMRHTRESCTQMCCGCIGVLALVIVSLSLLYFIFGMTSVLASSWDILGHWLLLR